jgi:hypothetical protein
LLVESLFTNPVLVLLRASVVLPKVTAEEAKFPVITTPVDEATVGSHKDETK